jgi:sulfur relay (sulfurtransferase) complex TusBCD TusD component (DsrE family)
MTSTAIVVFSDPKSGGEEALGRLFNALFLTYELKAKSEDVTLIFQGTGARWASEIVKPSHPAHMLYKEVSDKVVACGGCADVFGSADEGKASGIPHLRDIDIPTTTGVIDLSKYVTGGNRLITF